MKSIVSYSNLWDSDPILNVDFGDGSAFTLGYNGRYESFLKEFIPNLKDFFNGVIEEYHELTAHRSDYEDCFNTMISDFETVNTPYFQRTVCF
jgi:hypothetical protein